MDLPPNDICSGAFTIVPDNGTIFGSTEEVTDSGEIGCSVVDGVPLGPQSPDLWYVVEGTGGVLIASTCGEGTTYDSKIEILESVNGTCATLACVVFNDDAVVSGDNACSPTASQVEWFAALGTTYFIRVLGYSESLGSFQLSVTTPPPPAEL
jgi:hypothetical protein